MSIFLKIIFHKSILKLNQMKVNNIQCELYMKKIDNMYLKY